MGCHAKLILPKSVALAPLRRAWRTGKPIPWVRVHQLPDYVFFDHSVHIAVGLGCSTCHGRVDQMVVVSLHAPLSMSWCLACHRNPPRARIRVADDPAEAPGRRGARRARTRRVKPPLHCSGCHR